MSLQTLNDIFFTIAGWNQPRFMLRKGAAGWEPISSQDFATKVNGVVSGLRSWGISPGDRVGILSENRHEWGVAGFPPLQLGAVSGSIDTTLTADANSEVH